MRWLAWGDGSGAGREVEARETAEQAYWSQAACLAARSEESWRTVTRRTVKPLEEAEVALRSVPLERPLASPVPL